ncbi:MAG: 2-oxoglutarate dehydrogenase, E2 component, dihydrolipoamide succinyltransferase [Ignavibacteria bacterium]|jgi:2-oxoglutarate dehydrogenase E2 component (dihydrolipoamide succinyltransferase)|nr:2-oxoglutarate dehydrogenase, E2 component, dihydrolipoamide succinyltransferase [Ignavibacteria bacterium]MCU7501590.1 2-oxoglutarate dehydrogenase, E2 component, dihydrolipoamide succinyltransferase [Ignavibacteria bacterium]MCU7517127.1 2-oxoglutarate dehydrogenase, E2 component, dihydrolipoamide succinyltransferase [Ignavibacteria bacterium]
MKIDVVMPKMGESVNEGTIIKWHKKPGDAVKKDEIIFEISTDKVDTEIPSPADGILSEIRVFEQETVQTDTVVAVIETEASKASVSSGGGAQQSLSGSSGERSAEAPGRRKVDEAETPSTTQLGGDIIDIPMPKMGESVMEGTIIKWHKKPGETVKKDETLFEISTDKVDTEIPSPESGTLLEILVQEQETVTVGTIVAKISASTGVKRKEERVEEPVVEERINKEIPSPGPLIGETVKEAGTLVEYYKEPPAERPAEGLRPPTGTLPSSSGGRFYSPLVLNIAQKENVSFDELNGLKGTGLEGRVTKKDILDYIASRHQPRQAKAEEAFSPREVRQEPHQAYYSMTLEERQAVKKTEPAGAKVPSERPSSEKNTEIIPMDNIRQKVMSHMVKSRDTSVHVTAVLEVDVTKIHNFIKNNKDNFLKRENIKLTYMAFIAYACIKALKQYPYLNSTVDGTNIVLKKFINLGFAVAVEPNGLIVPNIKNADEKNITGLARAIAELSNKARTKKLTPDDISSGTFSITNYGVFGTLFGTPIINQPEVAILGVGTVTKKPVVIEVDGTDTIAIRHMLYLSLSHDHRLVDGMLGGRFLKFIKDTLENFESFEL